MSALRKSAEVRDLQRQTEAAKALRAALATLTDDDETIRDTIEGETDLHEQIAVVMGLVTEAEMQRSGLKAMIEKLEARKAAAEKREDSLRAIIAQAMEIGGLKKLPLAEATISLADASPKPLITDESLVPSKFWRYPDPVVDRKAINEAAKGGEEIPGVTMSNGSVSLRIRRV